MSNHFPAPDLCAYKCNTTVTWGLKENPDVSGTGVLASFTATAYMTLLILVMYYLYAHDPEAYHFQGNQNPKTAGSQARFQPNPIDKGILQYLRKGHLLKPKPRLANGLFHCIVGMADVQSLTGIAIMLSGYLSLDCGIQAYHWQVLIYTTWFSSVTHLTALTAMRQQLCRWRAMRWWRLILMAILAVLLTVGIIPTAGYDWMIHGTKDANVKPEEHVICHFMELNIKEQNSRSLISMLISVLIIMVSFATRAVKLHRTLSDWTVRLRATASVALKTPIRNLDTWCIEQSRKTKQGNKRLRSAMVSLARSLLYQPACTLFLVIRALMDIYGSMLWEMNWLFYACVWGSIHLFLARGSVHDDINDVWDFGQLLPMTLLLAPLVAVGESFCSFGDDHEKQLLPVYAAMEVRDVVEREVRDIAETQSPHSAEAKLPNMAQTQLPTITEVELSESGITEIIMPESVIQGRPSLDEVPQLTSEFDLDQDFYHDSFWFRLLISYIMVITVETSTMVFAVAVDGSHLFDLIMSIAVWTLFTAPFSVFFFGLLSFTIHRLPRTYGFAKHWGVAVAMVTCLLANTFLSILEFMWMTNASWLRAWIRVGTYTYEFRNEKNGIDFFFGPPEIVLCVLLAVYVVTSFVVALCCLF